MKTHLLRHVALTAIIALPIIGGCKPTDNPPSAKASTNAVSQPAPASPNVAAPATNAVTAPRESAMAEPTVPEVPFAVDRPIPSHLNVSTPLREVIKLAQAGVDHEVLLTFVNNSTAGFHAGADEIIFLTDIGVAPSVINAMLDRDMALKTPAPALAAAPPPAATVTQAVAAAPSYVNAPAAAPEPTPEAEVSDPQFTAALSPYGTWIEVEGYGRCWQPTVVVANPGWRPYCDNGRWMYTDSGWYWYSDYSWGWAPFHYGRWFSHPRWGWCWSPGYTWGPAWVTWSYTDSYCGWAPLPPAAVYTTSGFTYYGASVGVGFSFGLGYACYSYVPWHNFCDYRPWRYCAPRPHCKEIYEHSTHHNDYAWDQHHRAVNRGLPPERVAAYTRTEIKRVTVREVTEPRPVTGRREELARDGRTLELRRPVAITPKPIAGSTDLRNPAPHGASDPALQLQSSTTSPAARPGGRSATVPKTPRAVDSTPTHSPTTPGEITSPTPSRPNHRSAGQPLVVIGNGDGRPPTRSTWTPEPASPRTTPAPENHIVSSSATELADSQPAAQLPPQWTAPNRPVENPNHSQVIRVGRGIEDRPAGSPNYRVYSSPQNPPTAATGYSPTERSAPTTSISTRPATPSRSSVEGNDHSNYQPPQNPSYAVPRPAEPRAIERSTPPRTPQSEPRVERAEPRPQAPPARPEPSRSEKSSSSSSSRQSTSDSGRGANNR